MKSPIMTKISNNTNVDKHFDFGSDGRFVVPAQAKSIVLQVDVWGLSDERHRYDLIKQINSGAIDVSIMVISDNGAYAEVPFKPQYVTSHTPLVEAPRVQVTTPVIEDLVTPVQMADTKTHTIVVENSSADAAAAAYGLKSENVMDSAPQPVEEPGATLDTATGFRVDDAPASDAPVVEAAKSDAETSYNAYVENKQWDEAAGVIANVTGAEVKGASLKACKDKSYAAIVTKYTK